jgi:hypothetical protein
MAEDRMQMQRFELKYIIREELALQVRDFVACYLECDEFGATMPNLSYPVHSLYLDSDRLTTYLATINGDKNRYKLRLRFYEERPDAPVFFEVKSRMNNTISKKRGGVRRDAVPSILAGQLPSPSELISKDPKNLAAIQHFCRLMNEIGARPKAHIAYQREAWISRFDNSVRVTMDRQVLCDPEPTTRLSTRMINPIVVFGDSVILELKFTNRFPDWFGELVRAFGLFQCGAAKYADGVTKLGEFAVNHAFHFDDSKKAHTITANPEAAGPDQELAGAAVVKK